MKKENEKIIVEDTKFIDEESYQKFKKDMCKISDYFNIKETEILMQFLMQRQRKVIKNEEKRNKVNENKIF